MDWRCLCQLQKATEVNVVSIKQASRTSGQLIARGSAEIKSTISPEDQLHVLITMMRLRRGLMENELAYLFGYPE